MLIEDDIMCIDNMLLVGDVHLVCGGGVVNHAHEADWDGLRGYLVLLMHM